MRTSGLSREGGGQLAVSCASSKINQNKEGNKYRGGPIKDNLETRAALYPASMGSFQPKGWMSVTLTDHVRAAMSSLLFVSAELSSFSSSECSRSNNSNLSRLGALFDVPLCVSLGEVGG